MHPSAVKEALTDGNVVASAQSPTELMKQPSFLKSRLATVGVGTAGMLVGAFLFPPAAPLQLCAAKDRALSAELLRFGS